MATLYRKYRPSFFAEIVGQENVKQILLEELKSSRIAHAYLFSGPRGTGKTTTARLLAKALNCAGRQKNGEPCGECQSCLAIAQGRSQDLVEMDAASNRGIDEIRELREQVRYVPAGAPYKVYIIDEAHMLTDAAFNALLKTLEEPPKHVIFVLATTELHKIPETIFSRCQHFAFRKLALSQIVGRLQELCRHESVSVADDVLEEIARRSGGAMRDAEGLLGQILGLGKKKIGSEEAALFLPKVGFARVFGWLKSLARNETAESLSGLQSLEDEGTHLEFFLQEALAFARQIFLYKITGERANLELYFSKDETSEIEKFSGDCSLGRLRTILIELLRASQEMRHSPDLPILPIELAVVAICEGDKGQKGSEEGEGGKGIEKAKMEDGRWRMDNKVIPSHPHILTSSRHTEPKTHNSEDNNNNITNHSLADILAGWGEVLARVRDKNQALNFMLSVARPVAVRGDTVELAFKYRLQQERVSETKNQLLVEEAMSDVFGAKFRLLAKLQEDIKLGDEKPSPPKSSEVVSSAMSDDELLARVAMEVFPGAVVES